MKIKNKEKMIHSNKMNKNIKENQNNLLINNDKYSKNFVDVDINLKNNKQLGSVKTKYKTPGKGSKLLIPPVNNKGNNIKIKNENLPKKENKLNNIPNSGINSNKIKNGLKKKQNSSSLLKNDKKDIINDNNNNNFEIFNSDISIISTSTTKNPNASKDRIKSLVSKLENIYKEALNNSQKIKSETLPFNINYNQKDMITILLEEIQFLKIKNELIKLKSNFYETIFYSITELIEETKRYTPANQELTEYMDNFHNKILCILTQNNQKFYEHLKIFDDNSNNEMLFAFNLKDDYIMDKINEKNLSVLTNIEENIQKVINYINDIVKLNINSNDNNSDFTLKMNSFKLNLLMASNNIISYYLLSDNFNFQFKNKHKFMIFNPEDIINNQINQRKNKIKSDWEKLIKPLIHKVLTPKNEKDLINFILNLSLFYENLNKNINIENAALKINFDINNDKLNSDIKKLKSILENYINSNDDGFMKLNELFNFIEENQSKNTEKVIFSLINTEKQNYLNLIYNFNLLKKAIL